MNLSTELARFNPCAELTDTVQNLLDQMQHEAVGSLQKHLNQTQTELQRAQAKIQALTFELAYLKRLRFGARSEALNSEQRDLFQETLDSDLAAVEAELMPPPVTPPIARPPRARAGRQTLPEHLPRIEHRHEPESCACGQCGAALVKIGEDVSEQLDVEPAKFFVHRHVRPQYACRACETIEAAAIPPAVIDGGMAAVGLYVWVIIAKFMDHLPLYRLEHIAARDGVPLSRSTLAQWVGRIGVALQPLVDRLTVLLLAHAVLHADETPVAQLDPGRGKTKKAYLWVYRTNGLDTAPPIVVFDYQPGRAGQHARNFLNGWQGHLMVDDYAGYKALFAGGVIELGCLAHARRKFFDLHAAAASPIALEALRRIGELYAIEATVKAMDAPARGRIRQDQAQPKLAALHAWLIHTRRTVADGSGTAKAIDYSLKRWPALCRYATTGHLPIDNNPVENTLRPIAIGKKNWLFTGSERAGQRAAAIQSLLYTAKLNGLNPAAWLRETLERLPTCPNSQIDTLLPLRGFALPAAVGQIS